MKVLLIDDHPLILAALQTVIQGFGDDVTVVGVDNEHAARKTLAADADFDLVLLDLQLGASDGFVLLAEFRERYPALPVVVVSASDRTSDVIRAIDTGAMGFVPKRASNDTLFQALRLVLSGGIYVPPMSMGGTSPVRQRRANDPQDNGDTAPGVMRVGSTAPAPFTGEHPSHRSPESLQGLGLSKRQSEVLLLLLKGLPNKLIARELDVSVETVKDHVAAVLRALGVATRTQAVIAVSQMTQAQPPEAR
jgi:DNA-binding NarL/FixJ family response regulator